MTKHRPPFGDPAKRRARKQARKAEEARGTQMLPRQKKTAQMDHASNAKARRKAREGEQAMERERALDARLAELVREYVAGEP